MTALAAQESGLDKEFISDINADSPAVLRELYLGTEVVRQAVAAQEKVIRKIADNGACVIVGRAADYVLREYPNAVRVFLYAPMEFRRRGAAFFEPCGPDGKGNESKGEKYFERFVSIAATRGSGV